MSRTQDKKRRREARKERGAGPPPAGAVARLKAENLELRTKIAQLGAGLGPYMSAADEAVKELEAQVSANAERIAVLGATADMLAQALRTRQVRLVPEAPGGLDEAVSMLSAGCREVQAAQVADGTFLLFLAGAPEEPDRLAAMGMMIRDFGERHGIGILPMAAPAGRSVAEAFGLYRIEHVPTASVEPWQFVEAQAEALLNAIETTLPGSIEATDVSCAMVEVVERIRAHNGHLDAQQRLAGRGIVTHDATLRQLAPGEVWTSEPGTIADPVAYEEAKAAGLIGEIPPGDPRATAPTAHVTVDMDPPADLLAESRPT